MTPVQRYGLDSVDTKAILDSPEAFEIVDALLKLYRDGVKESKLQQETIHSLLDRLYGSKSEKSRYHPEQMLLLPELPEELAAEAEAEFCDSENGGEADAALKSSGKIQRKGGHGRSKLPAHIERRVVESKENASRSTPTRVVRFVGVNRAESCCDCVCSSSRKTSMSRRNRKSARPSAMH